MKVYKFIEPYDGKGRSNFRESKDRPGIYIIKEDGKIVYVGYSGYNVYKTMHRHFQSWNHPSQEVVSYKSRMTRHRYTVRIVHCTDKQAAALEKRLIQKYHPRDNSVQYDLYLKEQPAADTAYARQVEDLYFAQPAENVECPF